VTGPPPSGTDGPSTGPPACQAPGSGFEQPALRDLELLVGEVAALTQVGEPFERVQRVGGRPSPRRGTVRSSRATYTSCWKPSGSGMSCSSLRPSLPAASSTTSPYPSRRSSTVCENSTLVTCSSGISVPVRAIIPRRTTIRSVVST
jgi:hypothetical protein